MKLLLLTLSLSLGVSTQVNQFVKYFTSKPSNPSGCAVIGTYKNLIACSNTVMNILDANTGDFVADPFRLVDAVVKSNYLILFGADSTIEKWDLDTMTKVRQMKPAISSSETTDCAYDSDQEAAYCGLMNGVLRKVNMITTRIEFEVKAHSQYCYVIVGDSFVFSSGVDGLVKKYDKSGTLLATYEENLGYANVLGIDQNYLLVSYYEFGISYKKRFFRWNFETGQKEWSTDQYYIAYSYLYPYVQYTLIHKSNMTTAFTEIFDTFGLPSLSGDRLYWIRESKLYRSVLSGNNLDVDKILPLDYLAAFISTPLLLPTGQILVYFNHSFGNSFCKLLDPESGLFSEKLTQFDKHLSFQVVDNLLIGAQANNVVAYKLSDFQLAWNASSVVATKILSVKVSAGILYIQESDNIGLFNVTSLESIVAMGLTPSMGRYTDTLDGVVFTIDGNAVLSYDINTGTPLPNYVGPQNIVMSVVAFENHLYVGSWDSNIYKYSIGTSAPLLLFQGHISIVFSLLLEAQFLYSGSNDWTVRKWNKDTGEALFVYGGYLSSPSPFAVDDYSLYTYERDQITVWSLFTNRVAQVYFEKSFVPISLHFNGGILQSGTVDGSLIYWDVENGIISSKPLLGNSANPAYSFELQNQTYFIPKYDGSIIKWDYALSADPTIIMGIDAVQMTAFSVYEDIIFLFKKGDGFLKFDSNSQITTKIDITGYYSNVVVVIDDIIFSGNNDSTITRHSVSDLKILSSTKAHDTEVTVLAGYGQFLVSGGNDAVLKKWDRALMNLVLVMRREIGNLGHLGGITSIFILDDVLFSGSVDATAKKWDLSTGKVQFTYTGHIKKVRCVYYHNSSLFTSGEDALIQMFTVIIPKPMSSSATRTTALASRINPIVSPVNVNENATLSTFELIIIIASVAVALILSIFIFVRARSLKKQSQAPDSSGKFSSVVDTRFVTAVQDQTLVQTSVGLSIPASKEVSETDFILKTLLGKGGGGSVYYAKALTKSLQKYGETVVAKVLQGNYSSLSEPAKAMFNQEIGIMEMLQFKGGFAEMLGYSLKPCTIIMKLYKHGSLANWIRNNHIGSLRAIVEFFLNIATSISTMHKVQLAHCDLKPDNILIDEDRPGHFKCVITDFGICQVLSESIIDAKRFNHINVRGVSVRYAAPEAFKRFRRKTITSTPDEIKSGDVFSIGMILYEIMTRKSPWNYERGVQIDG